MYHAGNQLIDPKMLFEKARLRFGMHIADFGCGRTGHIVFPAALIIGEQGVIYAVDILKDVLAEVDKRARMDSLLNIHTVWSDLEHVGKAAIPSRSLDVVFVVNTLSQSGNRHAILEEALRTLKEKARLVIVDWARKGLRFGPADERFVDFRDIRRWASTRGLVLQEEFSAGQFHNGMVFYKHE